MSAVLSMVTAGADASLDKDTSRQFRTPPTISLIVAVDKVCHGTRRSIDEMQRVVAGADVDIIIASRERWADATERERVVVFDSRSRGDRYDRAAEQARGSLLVFTDSRMRLPVGWATRVLDFFADPDVGIAGGPVLPRSWGRGERVSALIVNRHLGATPAGHLGRLDRPGLVSELAGSNLVIRRDLFQSVGGFQSPNIGGEALRLCYKVRSLLERDIPYSPTLAVTATSRSFPGAFLAEIAGFGRLRGELARRYHEMAPFVPYGLPTLAVLLVVAELALLPFHLWGAALIGGALLLAAYLIQAVSVLRGGGRLSDRLLAAAGLPLVPLAYGTSFIRGFFGASRGEISPPRSRKKPLRILIINWRDVMHPQAGGAERYMHEIGLRWVENGIDVGWLCQRFAGSKRDEILDGIRVRRFGRRFTLYPLAMLYYITRLSGRYDVIVDCENGIPFFTPLFARIPSTLLVHHVHSEIFRTETKPPLRWLGLWLEGRLMPTVYRENQVVAVSESTRDELVAIGFRPDRIAIVHNGVASPPPIRPRPSPHPSILYVGRLTPQKCVDVILKAMPEVLRNFPDARLDIVGQGPDRTRLERLAWSLRLSPYVRFHGFLPGSDRDELAARAWVAVCPSALEGWGVSCVEASARRLPVVASDVSGIRDSVRNGETGVLVPHGDVAAFAHVLTELFDDPIQRSVMGEAGWHWAALHTWDRSASELLAVITDQTIFARSVPLVVSKLASGIPVKLRAADAR
jgi:glycosyltransferase involved in cell wall biosynthesis